MYLVYMYVPFTEAAAIENQQTDYSAVSACAHVRANTCVLSASEHLQAIVRARMGSLDESFCVACIPVLCVFSCLCKYTNACVSM